MMYAYSTILQTRLASMPWPGPDNVPGMAPGRAPADAPARPATARPAPPRPAIRMGDSFVRLGNARAPGMEPGMQGAGRSSLRAANDGPGGREDVPDMDAFGSFEGSVSGADGQADIEPYPPQRRRGLVARSMRVLAVLAGLSGVGGGATEAWLQYTGQGSLLNYAASVWTGLQIRMTSPEPATPVPAPEPVDTAPLPDEAMIQPEAEDTIEIARPAPPEIEPVESFTIPDPPRAKPAAAAPVRTDQAAQQDEARIAPIDSTRRAASESAATPPKLQNAAGEAGRYPQIMADGAVMGLSRSERQAIERGDIVINQTGSVAARRQASTHPWIRVDRSARRSPDGITWPGAPALTQDETGAGRADAQNGKAETPDRRSLTEVSRAAQARSNDVLRRFYNGCLPWRDKNCESTSQPAQSEPRLQKSSLPPAKTAETEAEAQARHDALIESLPGPVRKSYLALLAGEPLPEIEATPRTMAPAPTALPEPARGSSNRLLMPADTTRLPLPASWTGPADNSSDDARIAHLVVTQNYTPARICFNWPRRDLAPAIGQMAEPARSRFIRQMARWGAGAVCPS